MRTKILLLALIGTGVALLLSGCVSAHKRSGTVHELWEYQVITNTADSKPVALLTRHEVWTDTYHGGGAAFLADPQASQLSSEHANQSALGGSSTLAIGNFRSDVSTNGITAVGGVIQQTGAAVGDAAKSFVKP
jgi:hypothetical protein